MTFYFTRYGRFSKCKQIHIVWIFPQLPPVRTSQIHDTVDIDGVASRNGEKYYLATRTNYLLCMRNKRFNCYL